MAAGAASVRRGRGCPVQDTTCSSWLPPTLFQGKAEPRSQGGGASGKECLRKGERLHSRESSEEKMCEKSENEFNSLPFEIFLDCEKQR